MKLSRLVETSREIAATRSRLRKTDLLATLLRELDESERGVAASYLAGKLPGGRVGVGPSLIRSAGARTPSASSTLTVVDVQASLDALNEAAGEGSSRHRQELLRKLLERATSDEQEFLARLLMEDLRQGALEGLMVDGIAKAAEIPSVPVRRALMLSGDLRAVTEAALGGGEEALAAFSIELFRPLKPMMAQSADDIADAMRTLGRAALEYKIDGARIQVHRDGDEVRVYTRRLNEVTEACPEVVEQVGALDVSSAVLDGEAIALNKDGSPYPFQTTMRRFGRRLDVRDIRRMLPLSSFFFDCLFLNGEMLIDRPADERFQRLREVLSEDMVVPRSVTDDLDEARSFLDEALQAGHEGVVAKALDAPYEAGARGKSWLKVKSVHTLDLVVLAAEWGSGRREGWLSNLHLGARDPARGEFVMLGKTFKGMTDEILEWQTKRLQELETSRDRWTVRVRPELVVEIAFNDLQKSPHYRGGLALRFARLKRYRDDKTAEEADTIETVRRLYRAETGMEAPREEPRTMSLFPEEDDGD